MFLLAMLFCIGSIMFLILNRNNPIVSLSQPHFLGISFSASAIIASGGFCFLVALVVGSENDASAEKMGIMCYINMLTLILGQNVVYMALFGKLWRIQKVTQIRRNQTITVEQTIWPLRVVFTINLGLLVTWIIVEPPQFVEIDFGGQSIGACDFHQWHFLVPTLCLLGMATFLGLWMTYKTRNLPGDLNEGGRVFHVFIGNVATGCLATTLYFVGTFSQPQNPHFMNAAIWFSAFFISTTSVAPIAIPKMYYVWYEKKYGKLPEGVGNIGRGQTHVSQSRLPGSQTSTPNPSEHRRAAYPQVSSIPEAVEQTSPESPRRSNKYRGGRPQTIMRTSETGVVETFKSSPNQKTLKTIYKGQRELPFEILLCIIIPVITIL
jgi:hypothetical protein